MTSAATALDTCRSSSTQQQSTARDTARSSGSVTAEQTPMASSRPSTTHTERRQRSSGSCDHGRPATAEGEREQEQRRRRRRLERHIREAIKREGVYRDPTIDGATIIRVGGAGARPDCRPVVDSHARYFGVGRAGRERQVAHAQEAMAGGPLTPESNRRVLPLAVPVTPALQGAPHAGGSPTLLHTRLQPQGGGLEGFQRRPSAELRALDALHETKQRAAGPQGGAGPRRYHHYGSAEHEQHWRDRPRTPEGYVVGPLTESEWVPTAVPRGNVAPSAAVAGTGEGLGVREYTAVRHPPVRRIGGGSDPNWERRRPTLHKLHPDAQELLKLQEGWGQQPARRSRVGRSRSSDWNPPLVSDVREEEGRLNGHWEVAGPEPEPAVEYERVFRVPCDPPRDVSEQRAPVSLRAAMES